MKGPILHVKKYSPHPGKGRVEWIGKEKAKDWEAS